MFGGSLVSVILVAFIAVCVFFLTIFALLVVLV